MNDLSGKSTMNGRLLRRPSRVTWLLVALLIVLWGIVFLWDLSRWDGRSPNSPIVGFAALIFALSIWLALRARQKQSRPLWGASVVNACTGAMVLTWAFPDIPPLIQLPVILITIGAAVYEVRRAAAVRN